MGKAGESLRAWAKQVIVNSPGYEQWCRHRHEIDRKIEHWCRSTENHKRYLPYRNFPALTPFKKVYGEDNDVKPKSQNDLAAEAASERIKKTVEKLESEEKFPDGAVARTEAIAIASKEMFGIAISKSTLRKSRNLVFWHPKHRIAQTQVKKDVSTPQEEVIKSDCPLSQSKSGVSYTLDPKVTKHDCPLSQSKSGVSYTLPPMKCLPKATAEEQTLREQALGGLVSKPENSELHPPLPHEKPDDAPCNYSQLNVFINSVPLESCKSDREADAERHRPRTKILSSALASYRQTLEVKAQIESQVRVLTRKEIHRKYPGQKTIPHSDRLTIESSWRARLYWESGIPRLMKRSEEIWSELGEDW